MFIYIVKYWLSIYIIILSIILMYKYTHINEHIIYENTLIEIRDLIAVAGTVSIIICAYMYFGYSVAAFFWVSLGIFGVFIALCGWLAILTFIIYVALNL